jgi:hypothetical protein
MAKFEGAFVIGLYIFWCIAGLSVGFWFGVYVTCLIAGAPFGFHSSVPNIRFGDLIMLLSFVIGGTCVGMPLFVLSVKPFYTRKAVIELINSHAVPKHYSKDLVDATNGVGWFWFNLLYPEK